MRCLYYLAPTIESAHRITDDLHAAGIKDFFLHVIAKDESALEKEHLHSSNYLETLDIIRDGFIGAAIGAFFGLVGAGLLMFFQPFGPDVPHYVYFIIVGVATMFGAWEGGLTGIASENNNLKKFHRDIEAGKYLILVYARKEHGAMIRHLMREKHPEAELAAVQKHFINPFLPVRRRRKISRQPEPALQKD
ncbi:MAG: hypothetical protein ABI724_06950 [Betaproteobacteria bacterium]